MNAYRENDNITARITEMDDRLHDLEGRLAERSPEMDDNTKETRITAIISGSIVATIFFVIGVSLYACIDSHKSDVEVAKVSHACPSASVSK